MRYHGEYFVAMNGNENADLNKQPPAVVRGSTPKKYKLVVGLFLTLVIAVGGLIIVRAYTKWRGTENVERLARALRQYEQEMLEARMADNYGGKTPQETLRLYIEAVERGDYELASRYFIGEKREGELKSLQNSPKANMENVQELLKQTLLSEGSYSDDKKDFVIRKPLLVDFVLYPNGIWKIVEI